MGYYRSGGGSVRFKDGTDLDGTVLPHVKATMFTDEALVANCSGGAFPEKGNVEDYKWYSWTDTKVCRTATTLLELIQQFVEESWFDEQDPMVLHFSDSQKIGQEEVLFQTLAPFIEANTDVEWTGEDGAHWRWAFDGERMVVQDAAIIYPGMTLGRKATTAQIERARQRYGSDEIEIDDTAEVSASGPDGDSGVWVQAWVWLADETGGDA